MKNRFSRLGIAAARLMMLAVIIVAIAPGASAQRVALKTNALDYLTLSPNLALEARLSPVVSLQVGVVANPFSGRIAGYRLSNFRFEPELRYWFNRPMAKHFLALSLTAASYSLQLKDRILKGDAYAAGLSYGYALTLSKQWNVEFEIGLGLGTFKGYDYDDDEEKPSRPNYSRVLPVPIRCGVSFSYIFK